MSRDDGGRAVAAGRLLLDAGYAALDDGRWQDAVDALSRARSALPERGVEQARAASGLSEALWWSGRIEEALAERAAAYAVWRAQGDDESAAQAAVWLAREYASGLGNASAAKGWLARAERLAGDAAAIGGWVALGRALLETDPSTQVPHAEAALALAREQRDTALEVLALARRGLGLVMLGEVASGLRDLDEAMAAATGGEADLPTLATLCCDMVLASELCGDLDRFAEWADVVETIAATHGHPGLIESCATCCAEAFTANGDWAGAEQQLRMALGALGAAGHTGRCIGPAAKLADLLVDQGRFEEAEALVASDDSGPGLLVRARLSLAGGDPAAAVLLAERWRRGLGDDSPLTAPAIALLVEAHVASGEEEELQAADAAAERLQRIAEASGNRRLAGRAALAHARIAVARGKRGGARRYLEDALEALSVTAPGAVETAETRLLLAELDREHSPELAVTEAAAALAGFEAAGATHAADRAAALLRELGDRRRVGTKGLGVLTGREQEVLRLVAQGLTNAEIAERLYISVKTAGNHVSNILAKLGLRSRVEAAAFAALHPDGAAASARDAR